MAKKESVVYEGAAQCTITDNEDGSSTVSVEFTTTPPVPPEPEPLPPVKSSGLYCLSPAYKQAGKYMDPATESGNTNPNVQGILWRERWFLLEPAQGQIDWTYYDAAFLA